MNMIIVLHYIQILFVLKPRIMSILIQNTRKQFMVLFFQSSDILFQFQGQASSTPRSGISSGTDAERQAWQATAIGAGTRY